MSRPSLALTAGATALALAAFAANSLLCRAALAEPLIDPWSFTAVRLASGAAALALFLRPRASETGWSASSAAALLVYALAFSLAYRTLDAGVGALLLFGAVQVTMLSAGFLRGERLGRWGLVGFAAAIAGFLVQVAPGLSAPDPLGAALMASAGVAWGLYTLFGRGRPLPLTVTARNFLLAAPVAAAFLLLPVGGGPPTGTGLLLAVISGALTSGLGYCVWYLALRGHSATSAGLVQLAVPVIAAAAGVAVLGEALTPRLGLASLLTVGGIGLALAAARRPAA